MIYSLNCYLKLLHHVEVRVWCAVSATLVIDFILITKLMH